MQVEIKIDDAYDDTKIVIYAKEMTPEISELVKRLSNEKSNTLIGYKENEIVPLKYNEIISIYSENGKVLAKTNNDIFQLRYRLYELEQLLSNTKLIRISNSEIVNFSEVASLDMSISGTITLKMKTGEKSFVSRRYVNKIKNYIGI